MKCFVFIIIFILFISYYKIYENFNTRTSNIKKFKCGIDDSMNKIIKEEVSNINFPKSTIKKDALNINCPKSKKKCLSKKYLNKCGWCYFKNKDNVTKGKCLPGNKEGPLDKKKRNLCNLGFRYTTCDYLYGDPYTYHLIPENIKVPKIKCAYGIICNQPI